MPVVERYSLVLPTYKPKVIAVIGSFRLKKTLGIIKSNHQSLRHDKELLIPNCCRYLSIWKMHIQEEHYFFLIIIAIIKDNLMKHWVALKYILIPDSLFGINIFRFVTLFEIFLKLRCDPTIWPTELPISCNLVLYAYF